MVASVGRELDRVIGRMYPGRLGQGGERPQREDGDPALPSGFDRDARTVPSPRSGYVQAVDDAILMETAVARDLVLRLAVRPGDFLIEGNAVVRVWPPIRAREQDAGLQKAFLIGDQATPEQDVEFAIDQIEEIGLRALSPGFNDTFTAIHCVDWLAAGLARIAREELPRATATTSAGRCAITPVSTFAGLADAAFNQIRQIGRDRAAVMIRILEVLAALGERVRTEDQKETLRHHAQLAFEEATAALPSAHDRGDVQERSVKAAAAPGGHARPAGPAAASAAARPGTPLAPAAASRLRSAGPRPGAAPADAAPRIRAGSSRAPWGPETCAGGRAPRAASPSR